MCIRDRPHPGQSNYSQVEMDRATSMVAFMVQLIKDRVAAGGGGSLENPKGSRLFRLKVFHDFFGSQDRPKFGRFFATPDLCAYGAGDPDPGTGECPQYYQKPVVLAATYKEILKVDSKCPRNHQHVAVRGSVKQADGKWVSRGQLSGAYTKQLALDWGSALGEATGRLAKAGAERWMDTQISQRLSLIHI